MYVSQDMDGGRARRNLHEQIAHDIGVQIVRGDYGEQDLLPTEVALAESYRVSRTAVREAFRILAAKGMTASRPKIGTRVKSRCDWNMMDPDVLAWHLRDGASASFIAALFELRSLVEPQAAALAAERRSDRQVRNLAGALQGMQRINAPRDALVQADLSFHHVILEASGNPLFRSLGTMIEAMMKYAAGASLPADRPHMGTAMVTGVNPSTRRHATIYAAIRDRNPTAARDATAELIATSHEECLRRLGDGEGRRSGLPGGTA